MAVTMTCKLIRAGEAYVGQQGFTYIAGHTGGTAGARGLCMTVVPLPDGARAKTHLHRGIETAAYIVVAHSAADDQEGIALLPELDGLV